MATILIVDDSPVSRRMMDLMLHRNGYTVVAAADGYEALSLLEETPVDLMIVDLSMPDIDGLTLLERVRADARFHAIRTLMLTASGYDQDRERAQEAGANDYLTKPTSSRDLVATVGRLLD